ncbi:TPA: hypothetical protein N2N40_002381 [Citrobacter freundii]|nr:hypothetical protein [Citrobacter freundii]
MYGLGFYGLVPPLTAKPVFHYSNVDGPYTGKKQKTESMPMTPRVFKEKMITAGLALASIPVIFMIGVS